MLNEVLTDSQKQKLIAVISMFYPEAKIYLFGSFARGDFNRLSDIDIAVDNKTELPITEMVQIKNMIEALNLPRRVDVVDFISAPEALQENILKDGVLWKS